MSLCRDTTLSLFLSGLEEASCRVKPTRSQHCARPLQDTLLYELLRGQSAQQYSPLYLLSTRLQPVFVVEGVYGINEVVMPPVAASRVVFIVTCTGKALVVPSCMPSVEPGPEPDHPNHSAKMPSTIRNRLWQLIRLLEATLRTLGHATTDDDSSSWKKSRLNEGHLGSLSGSHKAEG